MYILMDYYVIIIKLGVMTWKDTYDAVLNTFLKKRIIQNIIPFLVFFKKERNGK